MHRPGWRITDASGACRFVNRMRTSNVFYELGHRLPYLLRACPPGLAWPCPRNGCFDGFTQWQALLELGSQNMEDAVGGNALLQSWVRHGSLAAGTAGAVCNSVTYVNHTSDGAASAGPATPAQLQPDGGASSPGNGGAWGAGGDALPAAEPLAPAELVVLRARQKAAAPGAAQQAF